MKVLIIDDDEGVIEVLLVFLQSQGIERVASLRSGKDAVKTFQDMKPDLVLLDICLPDIDGPSLMDKMRAVGESRFIMITGYQSPERVIESIRKGAIDVLLKPINWDYFKGLLNKLKIEIS